MIWRKSYFEMARVFLAISLFIVFCLGCEKGPVQDQYHTHIEDQIGVKFKKSTSPERIEEINRMMGTHVIKMIEGVRICQLRIPQNTTVPEMIKRYSSLPEVEYAEPAYKHRVDNQTAKKGFAMKESVPIHLAIGAFDPLSQTGPPPLSHELTLERYPEEETGYYILQFKGPVLKQWKDAVAATGAAIFDYIPQFAFLVRMDHQTRKAVQAIDSVRWVGIYQPGYRISPDLMKKLSEKGEQSIELIVSVFKGEDVSGLKSKIKSLGGKIIKISRGGEKIRLAISSNEIADLVRLSGVRYIERVPEFKLSPTNIKGRAE
jgi:hypothetical protein